MDLLYNMVGSNPRKVQMMNTRLQNQNFTFLRIALNRVLTLPDYSIGHSVVVALKIIDFENKNISVVRKH